MNQWQYETIRKILSEGAPALANDLCSALDNLVNECNNLNEEIHHLKTISEDNNDRGDISEESADV